MNDADKKKVEPVRDQLFLLDRGLGNFLTRGSSTLEFWKKLEAPDDAIKALKSTIIPGLKELLKEGKPLKKKMEDVFRDVRDLDKYASCREYRNDLKKVLAPFYAFDRTAVVLRSDVSNAPKEIEPRSPLVKALLSYLTEITDALNGATIAMRKLN